MSVAFIVFIRPLVTDNLQHITNSNRTSVVKNLISNSLNHEVSHLLLEFPAVASKNFQQEIKVSEIK